MAAARYNVWRAEVASDESQSYSPAQHSAVVTSTGAPQDAMVAKARTYLRTVIILSYIGLGLSALMIVLTGVGFAASNGEGSFAQIIGVPTAFCLSVLQLVFFGLSLALAIRARQQLLYFADVQQHNCCSQPGMICMVIFNSIILLVAFISTILLIFIAATISKAIGGTAAYAVVAVLAVAVFGLDITMLVFHIVLLCRPQWPVGARIGLQGGHSAVVTSTAAPQDAMVAKARNYLRTVILLSGIGLGLSVLMMVLTGVGFAASYGEGSFAQIIGVPTAFCLTVPQLVFFGLSLALAFRARKQLLHFADVKQHNCYSQPGMICMVIFNYIMLILAITGTILLILSAAFLSEVSDGVATYAVVAVLAVAVFGLDITMLVYHIALLCRQRWTVGAGIGVQGGAMTTTTTVQTIADPATTMPQHVVASPATAPEWTAQ